jgi:hypothetical protein
MKNGALRNMEYRLIVAKKNWVATDKQQINGAPLRCGLRQMAAVHYGSAFMSILAGIYAIL